MGADPVRNLAATLGLFALGCGIVIVGTLLIIRLAWP